MSNTQIYNISELKKCLEDGTFGFPNPEPICSMMIETCRTTCPAMMYLTYEEESYCQLQNIQALW